MSKELYYEQLKINSTEDLLKDFSKYLQLNNKNGIEMKRGHKSILYLLFDMNTFNESIATSMLLGYPGKHINYMKLY